MPTSLLMLCLPVLLAKDLPQQVQVPDSVKNPWPAQREQEFQERAQRVLRAICAKEKAKGQGGRTYFENEKRAYGYLMAHIVAGDKATALAEIQKEDAQAKDWHRHTDGIDYYACFTLKHQIRKYFLFGSQLDSKYRQRMFNGAKKWTEQDPMRRPHHAFEKPGDGWGPNVKNSWVDVRSTENLFLMRVTSVYLMAEETENTTTQAKYKNILLKYAATLFRVGMGEWDSENYHGHSIPPLLNLYDFAKDTEVKLAAKACLDYFMTIGALKYRHGAFNGPCNRDYNHPQPFGGSAPAILWLYFGDCPIDNTHYESDEVHVFTSAYRPPLAVVELAEKSQKSPVEIHSGKPPYTATTSTNSTVAPEYLETQYLGRTFQIGSLWDGTPAGFSSTSGFKILIDDDKKGAVAIQAIPGDDPLSPASSLYKEGKVAGENRILQHRNTAIWLCDNGKSPWTWVLPSNIKMTTEQGVTFLEHNDTWLALRPIAASQIQVDANKSAELLKTKKPSDVSQWQGHQVMSSRGNGGKFCGVIIEIGEKPDFANSAEFKKAILQKAKMNDAQLSNGRVAYTTTNGTEVELQFAQGKKDSTWAINGKPVTWKDRASWAYQSEEKNASQLLQEWNSGELHLQWGGRTFHGAVSKQGIYTFRDTAKE